MRIIRKLRKGRRSPELEFKQAYKKLIKIPPRTKEEVKVKPQLVDLIDEMLPKIINTSVKSHASVECINDRCRMSGLFLE